MMRTLYHQYECPTIDEAGLHDLNKLGITMRPAHGDFCYWPDEYTGELWKEVGRIEVWDITGNIDLRPYRNLNEDERAILTGAGWDAWFNPPSRQTHWAIRSKGKRRHWECVINMPAFYADPNVRIIRAAESFRQRQDGLFDGGLGFAA